MNVAPQGPSFTAHIPTGNPLAQTIVVSHTNDERWLVENVARTPWLRFTPDAGSGDGFFSIAVNIFDASVVIGTQTATLSVSSLDPTITVTVTLTVYAT